MASEILKLCMGRGFLLDREMLGVLSSLSEEKYKEIIEILSKLGIGERVITKDLFIQNLEAFKGMGAFLDGEEIVLKEPEKDPASSEVKKLNSSKGPAFGVLKLLYSPAFSQKKIEVVDFVKHFRMRYSSLKSILEKRDLENLGSIRKIGMEEGGHTIIVAVVEKRVTKNKNLIIEVEDLTGNSLVLVNQNKKDLFDKCRDLMVDDIVAFKVNGTKDMLFANEVIYPDAGLEERRYSNFDEYIAFISDIHAGSSNFLEKNLLKFVKWLNGEEGDLEQRALAKKVKYLIINGDNVDGVSVYPGQEKELAEKTYKGQYKLLGDILRLVRKDIVMVMGPGQHDSVWIGEPQPIIGEEYAPGLYEIENLHLVPNPSLIEVNGGFKILMYHGASINSFIDEMSSIRIRYGHKNPTISVKEMLKRRHLAPMHGMVDYIPCTGEDPLVIKTVPDIFTTGDQHRAEVTMYNNILLIATSCWQSITSFEEKVGNIPDPCKVPLFNLKTREVKILDFSGDEKSEGEGGQEKKEQGEDYSEYGGVDESEEEEIKYDED